MSTQTLEDAVSITKKFTTKPSNEELLKLYGLYKQAIEGDNETKRPGGFDFKAAAKYNAWLNFKGLSKEDAESQYGKLVDELSAKYI